MIVYIKPGSYIIQSETRNCSMMLLCAHKLPLYGNIDLLMYHCKNIWTTTILLSNLSCMSVVHMTHKFTRTKLLLYCKSGLIVPQSKITKVADKLKGVIIKNS